MCFRTCYDRRGNIIWFQLKTREVYEIFFLFIPALFISGFLMVGLKVSARRFVEMRCMEETNTFDDPCRVMKHAFSISIFAGIVLFPLINLFVISVSLASKRQYGIQEEGMSSDIDDTFDKLWEEEDKITYNVHTLIREINSNLLASGRLGTLENNIRKLKDQLYQHEVHDIIKCFGEEQRPFATKIIIKYAGTVNIHRDQAINYEEVEKLDKIDENEIGNSFYRQIDSARKQV